MSNKIFKQSITPL